MDEDRIVDSARDSAGKVKGAAGDLKAQAAGRMREATDTAVSYAKGVYDNSGETLRDGSQALAKKVQENPLGSLVIAVAAGFALALLMTRPPRRPPPRRWRYYS
jgi:ElaB/YqjD/DUF883 family membrane-anchored ribosome-binding protein